MEYTRHKAYEDSNILLDKNDFLIIEPLTSKAANYFLSRDKWTDLEKKITKDRYYIVIDKNSEKIYQIYRPYNSNVIYMDRYDTKIKKNDFIEYIEPILFNIPDIKILNEILELSSTYFILKSLLKNPNTNLSKISDELISEIKVVERSPGATRIYLDISLEDLMDILQVRENSYERDFITYTVGSTYSSWNYGSSDRSWEEFRGGYIFGSFNQENKEKLEEICSFFNPNVKSFGIQNLPEPQLLNLTSQLDNHFSSEVSEIRDVWEIIMEECYEKASISYLEYKFCNCFSDINIFKKDVRSNCTGIYMTSLKALLDLYEKSNSQHLSIKNMLKNVVNDELDVENIINGECYRDDWDSESYNTKISNVLYTMEQKIEENNDLYLDTEEYRKILNTLIKKFEFDKWYELPKDENKQISFQSVDPETNLIHFLFLDKKAKTGIKKGKRTLEDINLLLYHPEFDFED